ncbi:LOW QUALITY PROTEIN: hypothetical protein V2J09_006617 [Rumex salicifolius]
MAPLYTNTCSASTERARARRKLMSDVDLRKGLLEFVSSFGFPDGHIPSTKELAKHGRELLANSNEISESSNLEDSSDEEQNHDVKYDISEKGLYNHDKDVTEVGLETAKCVSSSENTMPIAPPHGSSLQEKLEKFLKCGIVDFEAVEELR